MLLIQFIKKKNSAIHKVPEYSIWDFMYFFLVQGYIF